MTTTQDRELRRALHGALQSVQPPPVPVEAIIRRGKGIRLRRAGAAVAALGVAVIVAVTAAAVHASPQLTSPQLASPTSSVPTGPVVPGGVIARGTAYGHPWKLVLQDIADPGYTCVPAVTINGTDADPVYPDPYTSAAVALGPAIPGTGFAFVQLPAAINGIVVDGSQNVAAVTAAACDLRYHVVGFAYSLGKPLTVNVANPPPSSSPVITMPLPGTRPSSTAGLWTNSASAVGAPESEDLASGTVPDGQGWTITLHFGTAGDCYEFQGTSSLGNTQMSYCGPVSTPDGPETIMALPLGFPNRGTGATGYALQVSPVTAALTATLSNGSSEMAAFCVVDGRKYAAFVVADPLRLAGLTWLDGRGQVIASTTALPRYGYVQFQP
jgi:hypothetical protein